MIPMKTHTYSEPYLLYRRSTDSLLLDAPLGTPGLEDWHKREPCWAPGARVRNPNANELAASLNARVPPVLQVARTGLSM